jgi:hypothetical protein
MPSKEHKMTTITLPATIIALLLAALLALIAGAVTAVIGRFLDPRPNDQRTEDEPRRSTRVLSRESTPARALPGGRLLAPGRTHPDSCCHAPLA